VKPRGNKIEKLFSFQQLPDFFEWMGIQHVSFSKPSSPGLVYAEAHEIQIESFE